jgi:hypothetical protein
MGRQRCGGPWEASMFGTGSTNWVRVLSLCAVCLVGGAWRVSAQPPAKPLPTPPPAPQDEAGAVTNVGGRWELNWRLSDKLPEQAGAPGRGGEGGERGGGHRGGGGGSIPGMGGFGGRGGTGGGGGGRGGEGRGGAVSAEQVRDLLQAQRTLIIVEHPDHVSITDENGQVQKFETNGEKVKDERGGQSFERRTHWDGRKLVTEVALSDGTKISQTYEKVSEGLQLVVTTKIEHSKFGGPRDFKRVYDQALQ